MVGCQPDDRNSSPDTRPPGRPRSERAHQAILDAANEILEERGFVDLTIDEIAQRAGVSKTTIYRRWPTKGTLVFEAFSADFLVGSPALTRDPCAGTSLPPCVPGSV